MRQYSDGCWHRKSPDKDIWEMTNDEKFNELWRLYNLADKILESFSKEEYAMLDNGAPYCLPNCIRWGLQCVGEIKKDKLNKNVFERQRNSNNIFTC